MGHWGSEIGDQATALATFLHHAWSRERFCATCLVGDLARYRFMFDTFPADLARWRWGDAQEVIARLLELKHVLRAAWRAELLQGAGGDQRGTVEVGVCSAAIESDYFWAYLFMVNIVSGICNHIFSWCQSCPCHRGQDLERLRRVSGPCPNQGRLLPQLACHELETFAEQLFVSNHFEVLGGARGLQPQQIMRILGDYESGRQHVLLHLRLKGRYHIDLPLVLAALAHPDISKARQGARRALHLWDGMTNAQRHAAHPVTRGFLGDNAGSHRASVVAFSQGTIRLSDAQEMEKDVFRFALAKIDEHGAESPPMH